MKKTLCTLAAGASLLMVGTPLFAHHSFAAEYDTTKPVEIKGTVTKVEWTNPHARFYIDVKDPAGKTVSWNFELASPNVLIRQGWTRHSLKEGDEIVVKGNKAKDGANMANAATVKLASGKQVFARSAVDAAN